MQYAKIWHAYIICNMQYAKIFSSITHYRNNPGPCDCESNALSPELMKEKPLKLKLRLTVQVANSFLQ